MFTSARLPTPPTFFQPPPPQNQTSIPPTSVSPRADAHYVTRIAELEEKVRLLQVQDVANKASLTKYKERWEKVKESMRKKKASKAASEAVKNRIEEEVEPE